LMKQKKFKKLLSDTGLDHITSALRDRRCCQ